jgi:hypothetical protein
MKIVGIIVAALLCFGFVGAGGCEQAEARAVKAADEAVDDALDQRDGKRYVTMVTKDSLEWYDRVLKMAREADRAKVDRLPFSEKYQILKARHTLSSSQLKQLDAKGYLILAIQKGWMPSASAQGFTRGKVVVRDKSATMILLVDGDDSGERACYTMEDGEWKEDVPRSGTESDKGVPSFLREVGMTENEYIFDALAELTQREVKPSIWEPPS